MRIVKLTPAVEKSFCVRAKSVTRKRSAWPSRSLLTFASAEMQPCLRGPRSLTLSISGARVYGSQKAKFAPPAGK